MTVGAGKYDDICTRAREEAGAIGLVLIVIGGKHGSGFSVQTMESAGVHMAVIERLPEMLRITADKIEADISKG